MRKTTKSPGEKIVKDIKRATRKQYSSEEKIRIVLDGLRGEDSIAELCRREGISQGLYYKWSKDFMEAGKKRLAGDTARAANSADVRHPKTNWASRLAGSRFRKDSRQWPQGGSTKSSSVSCFLQTATTFAATYSPCVIIAAAAERSAHNPQLGVSTQTPVKMFPFWERTAAPTSPIKRPWGVSCGRITFAANSIRSLFFITMFLPLHRTSFSQGALTR